MGWFNNAPTSNRINNEVQISLAAETLNRVTQTLTTANEFVQNQRARAQNLVAQAFSVQGASSALGRQLQSAQNELASYLVEGESVQEQMAECSEDSALFREQFQLPRAQRVMPSSGQEIAAIIAHNAQAMSNNVKYLRQEYQTLVNAAIDTIDNADRQLNGVWINRNTSFLSD